MVRRRVWYRGTVQGVGFRWTTRRVAAAWEVSGYVRNLADGRVEVVAEGEGEAVRGFLGALEERMGEYIRDREIEDGRATGEFGGFEIRH